MKNLAQHTIVIPTYNRPDLLQQLVRFYQNEASHMALLVLDSSAFDMARLNQERLAVCGSSVVYRHYASSTPMAKKLAQGLGEVTTPTVSFCADDDVVFPHAVDQSIRFLNQASDFVCSHGLYINFSLQTDQVHVFREYGGESNLAHHAGARIFRLCQNYESLFYAVFRTQNLQQIFAVVRNIPSLHFQELFQSVAALMLGKVNRFADFYAARRSGPEAEPGREKWQTYYWFADDTKDMLQHYGDYRQLAFAFYQQSGATPLLSEEAFMRAFDLAHTVYFARNCPPAYFHDRLQDLWPEDPFIKKPADLFEELRKQRPSIIPLKMREWFAEIQRVTGNIQSLPAIKHWRERALTQMNREIAQNYQSGRHQHPWNCHLPPDLLWLAQTRPFKKSFNELCRYLDCAELQASHPTY